MKRLLGIFLPAFVLIACHPSKITTELEEVSSYLSERPDSALHVLQSIPPYHCKTDAERAKYALLLSMALDKNYIDICSDSLIRPAVDYYLSGIDRHSRFLTCYYLGRIYENAGDRRRSIETYTLAERDTAFAEPTERVRLFAARYRLYMKEFALGRVEEDIRKASLAAGVITDLAYQYRVRLDKVGLRLMQEKPQEGKEELIKLHHWMAENKVAETSDYYALLLRTELESGGAPDSSDLETYLYLCGEEGVIPDSLLQAEFLLRAQDYKGAAKILHSMTEDDLPDRYENARREMLLYRYYQETGDYPAALDAKNRYDAILESINIDVFNHESQFIEERFRAKEALRKKQASLRRTGILAGLIILIISCVSAAFIKSRVTLRQNIRELQREYSALTRILISYGDSETPAFPVIKRRIAALKPFISTSSKSLTDKTFDRMKEDRKTMLESVGLMYAISTPGFVQFLAAKDLTPAEIGICAFYLSDYSTKEMPDIIGQKSIYQINARIRSKLGLTVHDTTLPLYLKSLFSSSENKVGTNRDYFNLTT